MREERARKFQVRKYLPTKDDEGNTLESYAKEVIEIDAQMYPAGGKIQASVYGSKLPYTNNLFMQKDARIEEKDGVYVKAKVEEEPDYRVVAIQESSRHMIVTIQKV